MERLAVCSLLVLTSCVPHLGGVRLYEMDLRLSIEIEESEGQSTEDALQCAFVVSNAGNLALDACIDSASRGVRFLRSGDIVGFQDVLVDHPECSERFRLGPGQKYRSVVEMDVPSQARGADEIAGWISVVDPINCGFGGCRSVRLEAGPVPLRRPAHEEAPHKDSQ